jgi:thiol-disulfide isomerase/thioredoxin
MSSMNRRIAGAAAVACILWSAGVSRGDDDLWQTNFEAAKAKAKAEHKMLLVEFSGSDWCPWCKKLKTDVFDKESFKTAARKGFVLVNLDYPNQNHQSAEIKRQNSELLKQYKVNVYPTIFVMDAKGQPVAQTFYHAGGPEDYMQDLTGFVKTHREIVAMKKKLEHIGGLDRAKLLDEIVMDYDQLGVENGDVPKYSAEIIALDAENKTGLKLKYAFRTAMAEADALSREKKFDAARAAYEKAATQPGVKGKRKQEAWFAEGECCARAEEFGRAVACLNKAREAAPEGPKVSDIAAAIQRYAPLAEAKQAILRLTAEAESAQGLGRARVLDRLVDAQVKFGQLLPAEHRPQVIEKWSNEIIELDPDNQAGLKTKYRLRELLIDAAKHLKTGETEKARTAIDEARALPDLTDDQKAKVHDAAEKLPKRKTG